MELFKINELRQYQFVQVPKQLLYSTRYKELSSDAKLIYGLLLDRMELSRDNGWVNENYEIYLIFSRESIQKILGISDKTCTKAFKQLKTAELIREVKQGLGKPNIIYIGHIIYDSPESFEKSENRKKYDSRIGNTTSLEQDNLRANNTNINNTYLPIEEKINDLEIDSTILKIYKQCISNIVSDKEVKILLELRNLVGKDFLEKAIIIANLNNSKNLSYIKAVLYDWKAKGLKTVDEVELYLKYRASPIKKDSNPKHPYTESDNKLNRKKKTVFTDYPQREYDWDDLERKLLGWEDDEN